MLREKKSLFSAVEKLCTPYQTTAEVQTIEPLSCSCKNHLTAKELTILHSFKNEKRKMEWFAGRVAAKRALLRHYNLSDSSSLEILREAGGAPICQQIEECCISITHSEGFAIAAVSNQAIGIDLERIEKRPSSFVRTFFSQDEQDFLLRIRDRKELHCNLIWTAKEAVSKVVKRGGSLNFKTIETRHNPVLIGGKKSTINCHSNWTSNYMVTLAVSKETYCG